VPPRLGRAALHATAPVDEPAPFHDDHGFPLAAISDTAIESRAAIWPHATLDVMPDGAALAVHRNQSAACG